MEKKTVKSKPYFLVDRQGNIYWEQTGTKLKPFKDKDGYLRITYRIGGKSYHIAPHRAVAEVFVENPRPSTYKIVNHKDGNKTNNSPENLQWADCFINRQHAHVAGLHHVVGQDHPQATLSTETVHSICQLLEKGWRRKDIAETCNVEAYQVGNIKAGKSWIEISSQYDIDVKRKDTISQATIKWIKKQLSDGLTEEEIISMSRRFSEEDKDHLREIIRCECLTTIPKGSTFQVNGNGKGWEPTGS